jgi:hypothetical protein
MKLLQKFYDHGEVDVSQLLSVLPNITEEHWYAWQGRNEPTIPFLFMPNFTPPFEFDKIVSYRQPSWLEDIVLPLGQNLEKKFNGRILKLMLIAVEPEAINGYFHIDPSETLTMVHRFHMPLVQSDLTRYHVGGEEFAMKVGHWYEKDNTLIHAVVNYAEPRQRRMTLQCDVLPLDETRFDLIENLYPRT